MRFDLKTPCKNCPFRSDGARIVFRCRERAEEIEEQAYRRGFPCHLSAKCVDDEDTPDGESGGFYPTEDTQHCVGYVIMQLHDGGGGAWPGIDNDEALAARLSRRVNMNAPVFRSAKAFFEANSDES